MSAFFDNIDYGLLGYQRLKIIEIIDDFVDWQEEGSREDQIEALEGVLNLLDALTDEALRQGVTTESVALMPGREDGAARHLLDRNGLL